MPLPRFRIGTLMIAVAVVGAYIALARTYPTLAFWVAVLLLPPSVWTIDRLSRTAGGSMLMTVRRCVPIFVKAFAINVVIVDIVLLMIPVIWP